MFLFKYSLIFNFLQYFMYVRIYVCNHLQKSYVLCLELIYRTRMHHVLYIMCVLIHR